MLSFDMRPIVLFCLRDLARSMVLALTNNFHSQKKRFFNRPVIMRSPRRQPTWRLERCGVPDYGASGLGHSTMLARAKPKITRFRALQLRSLVSKEAFNQQLYAWETSAQNATSLMFVM